MNKIKIWSREFDLEVVYDCFEGEEVLQLQKDAFEAFSKDNDGLLVFLKDVEKYCVGKNKDEIGADHIDNIFKYVMPESIFVKRDGRIALMCKYKFDMEHGIAVVFKDGALKDIGPQDIIL